MVRIRLVRPEELGVLQAIELAAGEVFHDVGMPEIAGDEPLSLEQLDGYRRVGRAWVVDDGGPVAYVVTEPVDGFEHIEQVSVHPDHARRGLGRRLIDHVASTARVAGVPALTLTTFVDVPWNAPYYERLGFEVLPEDGMTPGLLAIREQETAHGLYRWPRVTMRREL